MIMLNYVQCKPENISSFVSGKAEGGGLEPTAASIYVMMSN